MPRRAELQRLLNELRGPFLQRERRLRLLQELAETKRLEVVPHVLAELILHDLPVEPVAQLIEPLVARMTTSSAHPSEPPGDAWYLQDWRERWARLRAFRQTPKGWAAFAVTTFSRNGYLREASLRALAEMLHDGREILFLALRASDHVDEVREAALTALRQRLDLARLPAFVEVLPLLHRLSGRRRGERSILDWVLQSLAAPHGWPALIGGLDSRDQRVRRECAALAVALRPAEVLERVLTVADPIVRLLGVRGAGDDWQVLRNFTHDKALLVRDAAFTRLQACPDAAADWRRALLDTGANIRAMARRRLLPMDFASFYRDAVASGKPSPGAIAGLAETCPAEDAAELLFVAGNARIREHTARALSKMLGAEAVDALVPLLADSSARVRLTARRALSRHDTPKIAQEAWRLLERCDPARADQLLRFFALSPRWDALSYLLRAAAMPDPVRAGALPLLRRWIQRAPREQRPLAAKEASALRELLAAVQLSSKEAAEIDFELVYWVRKGK